MRWLLLLAFAWGAVSFFGVSGHKPDAPEPIHLSVSGEDCGCFIPANHGFVR